MKIFTVSYNMFDPQSRWKISTSISINIRKVIRIYLQTHECRFETSISDADATLIAATYFRTSRAIKLTNKSNTLRPRHVPLKDFARVQTPRISILKKKKLRKEHVRNYNLVALNEFESACPLQKTVNLHVWYFHGGTSRRFVRTVSHSRNCCFCSNAAHSQRAFVARIQPSDLLKISPRYSHSAISV